MRIKKNSFFDTVLRGLSLSGGSKKRKKYIKPETLTEKLLTGLSFSFDTKNESLVRRRIDPTIALEFGRLWDNAHRNMRLGRLGAAEKALRKILEVDYANAAAYNRIGIIKAKQKKYDESISMFKHALRFEKSASATHNLALVYFESKNYKKSEHLFRKSIRLDRGVAARHVALAKVLEARGKDTQMFKELIYAVELEPSRDSLKLLEIAYRHRGMIREADLVRVESNREGRINKISQDKSSVHYRISERSDRVGMLSLSYE